MRNKTRKERKTILMKITLKSIIALIVCIATVITSISAGTGTAYAAEKKIPLKVGFNGEEVTLVNDLNEGGREDTKVKKLEEKWGKPYKTENLGDDGKICYTWKKGKTSIEIINNGIAEPRVYVGHIYINIKDKNGSLLGVKVGMKTATALKKLKKIAGNKNTILVKKGQELQTDKNGNYIAKGEATGDGKSIHVTSIYAPIGFTLKNGKVSSIGFSRS